MKRTRLFAIAGVILVAASGVAQESRSEIGLQGIGFFTQNASGEGISRRATGSGGVLVPYRYHIARWLSLEAAYGYGRNTQKFYTSDFLYGVQTNVHQVSGGFVVNIPAMTWWKLSPYILTEGGALIFSPTGTYSGSFRASAERQTKGTFIYGTGLTFPFSKHFSFRAEYRGLVYSPPTFNFSSLSMGTITHTAQPSLGISYRF